MAACIAGMRKRKGLPTRIMRASIAPPCACMHTIGHLVVSLDFLPASMARIVVDDGVGGGDLDCAVPGSKGDRAAFPSYSRNYTLHKVVTQVLWNSPRGWHSNSLGTTMGWQLAGAIPATGGSDIHGKRSLYMRMTLEALRR